MVRSLIDNDVIIKLIAYGLGRDMIKVTNKNGIPPAMLGVGRFVVRDRLARGGRIVDSEAALGDFDKILSELLLIEPSEKEIEMAAEFEQKATLENLELDGGESQLLAILIAREAEVMITGDKRAIRAIAGVASNSAKDRVACLEQTIASIIEHIGIKLARERICKEPNVDKAITICFACRSEEIPSVESVRSGLCSYIEHVRKDSSGVMLKGELLAFTP